MRLRAWTRQGSASPSLAWNAPEQVSQAPLLGRRSGPAGQPAEAWQTLEEDLGRGLLDELAARQDRRLTLAERDRFRDLTAELERLDKLVESTPKNLNQVEHAKRFEDLKHRATWPASRWVSFRPRSFKSTELWRAGSPS